jgi:hypothetical protein
MMRTLPLSLLLLATGACGQDLDLGSTRNPLDPAIPGRLPPAAPDCAPDDVALLKAPASCATPVDNVIRAAFAGGGIHGACIVDGGGSSAAGVDPPAEPRPACPFGVYWSLDRSFLAENVEAAVATRRGGLNQHPYDPDTAEVLARTVDVFADRPALFVKIDPRPARGHTVEVALDFGALFRDPGSTVGKVSAATRIVMSNDDPVIAAPKR